MLSFSSDLKIFVCTQPTDMRKGFCGLSGIVRSQFECDPTDGSLFIFINRRRDRMKLLHFDGQGFWLYYRLLEAGTFEELLPAEQPDNDADVAPATNLQIDSTQLTMLLAGVSLVAAKKRRKRFSMAHDQATKLPSREITNAA